MTSSDLCVNLPPSDTDSGLGSARTSSHAHSLRQSSKRRLSQFSLATQRNLQTDLTTATQSNDNNLHLAADATPSKRLKRQVSRCSGEIAPQDTRAHTAVSARCDSGRVTREIYDVSVDSRSAVMSSAAQEREEMRLNANEASMLLTSAMTSACSLVEEADDVINYGGLRSVTSTVRPRRFFPSLFDTTASTVTSTAVTSPSGSKRRSALMTSRSDEDTMTSLGRSDVKRRRQQRRRNAKRGRSDVAGAQTGSGLSLAGSDEKTTSRG